ncbi:MAG: PEP-CTERM sorting domain-containing protein [Azoarcus sp.]|jgi:MYXO-CTERM domain-containing protein|nr:PEP-CTERM sorting domain-containing protein [Azoarcus sp.]
MSITRTRIALAVAGSALLLGSPLAQASADYFPTSQATMGGHLYVADPTKDVTIQLGINQNSTNHYGILQWKDGVNGEWQNLYTVTKENSIKYDAQNQTFTIDSSLITSGEIYLGYIAAPDEHHYVNNKTDWIWEYQTGEANTSNRNLDGLIHAGVVYDYQGQLDAMCSYIPKTPTGENVALVGFEDKFKYDACYKDFDDLVVFVTNVQASPAPDPETYAMLLAGLGVVGAVARRRRKLA